MKKKIDSTEIDLSDIIITILKNKLKVFLIALIPSVISLTVFFISSKEPAKIIFVAETEILSNSIFEDYEYQAFNSFVDGLIKKNPTFVDQEDFSLKDKTNSITIIPDNIKNYNVFSNFDFEKIDRLVLYELFIEKLNQKDFFLNAVRKFNLIKKGDYQNDDDYENAILKLASSIKTEKIKINENKSSSIRILAKTNDKLNWEKFLEFVERSANTEIQIYLKKKFELLVLNIERISNFIIEDIEFEISTNSDQNKITTLKNIKKRIIENKDVNRLKNLYNDTSIMNSNNFSAGKVKVQSTKYKDITEYPKSLTNILLLSLLLGVLLSFIFVLFINSKNYRR